MKRTVRIGWRSFFLLLLVAGLSVQAVAQLAQPNRFEKEQKRKYSNYNVVSLEEHGLALLQDKEKYEQGDRLWEFTLVDTLLAEVWTTNLAVKQKFRLIGYDYRDKNLYYLFRSGEAELGDIKIFKLDLHARQVLEFDYKPELAIQLTHFNCVGNQILLAGYVSRQPTVLLYNMETNQAKVVPGMLTDNTEILDVRANINNTFNVMMSERQSKSNKRLILKTFDESGALLLDDMITIDPDKTLLAGITSTLVRDELMLVGTWSEGISKQASGVFTVLVDPYSDQKINFYDFGQLTHFFDYLTPNRAAKTKEKSDARRKAGKIPEFKTNFLPVRLTETKNGFLFFGEAYYSSGISNNPNASANNPFYNYPYGMNPYGYPSRFGGYGYPYGAGYPYGGYPYGGYPYDNGLRNSSETKMQMTCVIILDQNGQLVTDHGLKLEDLKIPSVEQVSDFVYTPSRTTLVFSKENQIHFQVSQADGVQLINEKKEIQLTQASESIRINSDEVGAVRHWYKNVQYLYGYQTIKNQVKGNRDVFFINKLKID
jgi:hypothetical protein